MVSYEQLKRFASTGFLSYVDPSDISEMGRAKCRANWHRVPSCKIMFFPILNCKLLCYSGLMILGKGKAIIAHR